MTNRTPAMIATAIAIFMAIFLIGITIGSVIEIFDDPMSNTSKRIDQYQTYFAGVLALIAAITSIFGLYSVAHLPIVAEEKRRAAAREEDRETCRAIVYFEVAALRSALAAAYETTMTRTVVWSKTFERIEISDQLKSKEVLGSQPYEVVKAVANLINAISSLNNSLMGKDLGEYRVQVAAGPMINECLTRANALCDMLGRKQKTTETVPTVKDTND